MFEIGARYEFCMIEGGNEVVFWDTVTEYEHPLIKLKGSPTINISVALEDSEKASKSKTFPGQPGRIINVTSSNFVSAQRK